MGKRLTLVSVAYSCRVAGPLSAGEQLEEAVAQACELGVVAFQN